MTTQPGQAQGVPLWDDVRIVELVSSYSNLRVAGIQCMSMAGVQFLLASMRDEYEAKLTAERATLTARVQEQKQHIEFAEAQLIAAVDITYYEEDDDE